MCGQQCGPEAPAEAGRRIALYEIGELAACRGSIMSSEGLVGDRTSFVTDVFFNVMKGLSAVAMPTGGSAAI